LILVCDPGPLPSGTPVVISTSEYTLYASFALAWRIAARTLQKLATVSIFPKQTGTGNSSACRFRHQVERISVLALKGGDQIPMQFRFGKLRKS